MICFPNAKINLGLNILNKRNDGFHNLDTVFFPIDWCDVLEIIENKNQTGKNKVDFNSDGILIDGKPENNFIVKAYSILDQDFNIPPVKIHLHKVIPMGAGLGGGSSDAAFTINLLDELFGLGLTIEQKIKYAKPIGSDCAFFIEGKTSFAEGRGELLHQIDLKFPGKHLITVWPGIHVNTAMAYKGIVPCVPKIRVREIISSDIEIWKDMLINDFEKTIFKLYPEIEKVKTMLYELGSIYSSMSGSGSAVFGIFNSLPPKIKWPANYKINLTSFS
jgi:4-diphosphocytidyl-2-C-methyl-D-erythritol kinase